MSEYSTLRGYAEASAAGQSIKNDPERIARQKAASAGKSTTSKPSTSLSAYLSNKTKYGSSDKWYDAAKEEEDEAKKLVEKLEQELKYREQTEWANSLTGGIDELYGVKNETSENYKSSEELSKELEQAKAKLKSAEENLKYADEWKYYDADTAWFETVDKSGQDWGFVSDNLKVMADNTSAVYEDAYKAYTNAIKQNEALNNRRDKVPSEVGYSYTSDEELARLESNMVQARELRDMASRRYGYSLDKLAEDEQSVARGELRAGHIAQVEEAAYSENLRGYISGMESGELGSVTGVDIYKGYTRDSRPTDTWSQEQRNRYYVILDRNGEEAAAEYAVNVNTYNNAQALDDVHERAYAWGAGGETGIGRGALVTVGKVLSSAEGLISFTDKARRIAATGVYAGDAQPWLHDYLDPAAQGRADRLNTLGTVGGKGLGDIYQLTNSMAQSIALGNAAGMGVTLAAYFGQAADQGFDEAMSRGATPEQALQFGFYAGAAEAVAEIIPLENLLNANKSLTRGFLKSALIQAGLEGLEEGETALMTMLADEIAMKDKSAINAAIKERMEAGESYEDAAKAEWGNFVKDIAWSMVGGAISGAGASAVQHGIVMGSEYENGYGVSAAQLGREAAAVTDNKSLAELGKKVEAKAEKGKSITNYTAKKLAEGTNRVSIVNATEQQVKERVPELNAKDARALANAIVSESRGEKNGPGNQKLIDQHRDVADSLLNELGKNGEVADWAKSIGVRGVESIKYGTPERVAAERKYEEMATEILNDGEYAEARANLIEKGQNKIEYATDFDYVAEVYGNRKKTENFEEAWEAIKGETVLTKAQAKAAWDAGKAKLSTADMSPKQKRKGSGKTSFEAVQDGDTTYEAPSQEEIDSFKRSARYEYLEELAKQIGVDIVFFKGGTEGINGKYKNGTVYLAIDASPSVKESVDGYVMLTAAHELTHYIREASPARYAELKDFVIEHLIEKGKMEGKTLKELIRDKYNAYAKAGVELGVDGVIEELIADACEMMLKDNRIVAKLKVENESLHGEIVKWLKKFMSKVHRAFKGLEAHHTEAMAMMDSFKELQQIWNLGLTEAEQTEGDVEAGYARDVSGGKSSIKETMDGRYVAVVDNDILSNIDTSAWDKNKKQQAQKAAAQAMKKFIAGVVSDGELKKVNKRSRDHFTRSGNTEKHYRTDKTLFAEKMRISSAVGDILTIAREWKLDGGLTHEREDNFVDFEKTNVLILSGNNKYSAVAVCGVTNVGEKVFYDIEQIEPTEFEIKKVDTLSAEEMQNNAALANYGVSTDASVSQDSKEGKRNLSIKDEAMSDRMILANALMELAETEAEKAKLTEYQQMVDKLDETQVKLDLAEKELSKAYRAGDKDAIAKAQKERDKLGARLNRADRALVSLQATKPMRDMLNRAKREARYKTQRRIRDSVTTKKYQERVFEKVDTLSKWLMKNSDKEHVPEALKAPLIDFLTSIDLRSKQMLKKGKSTAADKQHMEALDKLRKIAEKQQKYLEGGEATETLDMFLDFGDLPDAIENYKDSIKAILSGEIDVNTESPVMRMNAEQLKDLDHILTVLTTAIRKANKFLQESHYASVIEAARAGREAVDALSRDEVKKILGAEGAERFLTWSNTIPYYAFKRFGEAGTERFEAFIMGWAKMAMNIKAIQDFTKGVYDAEQVKEWESELHEFEIRGQKFKMSAAQVMGLYCSSKREQAMKHLDVGGMRIGNIETKGKLLKGAIEQKKTVHLTAFELAEVVGVLSEEQIKVADELQKFMNTVCSDWGNEISMERFGYRQFTEENYYPIKSVEHEMNLKDKAAEETDLFRLINMSATKALNPNANNAILINSIFDVFAAHSADMAKYNGLALPVLDMVKWYNYREKSFDEYGHMETKSMHKSIEAAFGGGATNYVSSFIKDLNGIRSAGRADGFVKGLTGRYKAAAVAMNLRVIAQQPTSIVRAAYMIDKKYLVQGAAMSGGVKEAMEHSGLAQWKSMGFFDTNIARGVTEQIKGAGSAVDKVKDLSMKGAEFADQATWGAIWNACKLEQRDKGLSGKALMDATTRRFNEVIVATQVMDSTITKSHLMRDQNAMTRELTSFKAEPTVTYNILLDSMMELVMEHKRTGSWQQARKKAWPMMWRAGATYVVGQFATAAAAAIVDAMRDDDEYQDYIEKWLEHLWSNFTENMKPWNLVPVFSEIINVLFNGETKEMMMFQSLEQLRKGATAAVDILKSIVDPDAEMREPNRTDWGRLYQAAQALSSLTGIPVSGFMRDFAAIWNNSGGLVFKSLGKLRTYDSGVKNEVRDAVKEEYLEADEAIAILLDAGEYDNADDAYWQVQEWLHAEDSEWTRYNDAYAAVLAGDMAAYELAVDELGDHGIAAQSVRNDIKRQIGRWFVGGEDVTETMDEKTAVKALQDYAGLLPLEAQHYIDELKFEKQYKVRWSDMKAEYIAGTFSAGDVRGYRKNYGHEKLDDINAMLKEWDFEKATGIAWSQIGDAYVNDDISREQYIKYQREYGGLSPAQIDEKLLSLDATKKYGVRLGSTTTGIKANVIEGNMSAETAKNIMMIHDGKTEREAEVYTNQYLFEKETGYAWSGANGVMDAYADGAINDAEALEWFKAGLINGTEEVAEEYLQVAQWRRDVPGAENMNREGVEKWNKYGKNTTKVGLGKEDFANAWEIYSAAKSEYDVEGNVTREKKEVVLENLYELYLNGTYTLKEIEGLALSVYAASTVRKAKPW